ncbi:MAG: ABC transporter substrate-binding protein [Actinobacteria bacterium]|nr:ABC transporter substrate-binding protein [Actinomycetota bacterium]
MTPSTTVAALLVALTAAAACASGVPSTSEPADPEDWAAVTAAAEGQTVRWWLFGGDDRVNRYIDDHVTPAAEDLGLTVERVPVSDTADAVQQVLAEHEAGVIDGTVDLIWINGENFALGKRTGLWLQDWSPALPNAELVDLSTVERDFGVPVEGQESPWSRALFTFAYDTARIADPPATFAELLAYARANPGRVTYPAPPDFTGSAFVRQVVQVMGEDAAFTWLRELREVAWREGRSYPGTEAELNQLFGDGQVDVAMSYDPGFVETAVRQGVFAETARPFVLEHGTLHNVSYVTIPANATNVEGALVLADLLLEPDLQAIKADPEVLGVPTVLDLDRLAPPDRARFEATRDSPYVLDVPDRLLDELAVERVEQLERRWLVEVLR